MRVLTSVLACRLLRLSPGWVVTVFVLALQVLIAIVIGSNVPAAESMTSQVSREISDIRWLLLPGVIALYIKSFMYIIHLAGTASQGAQSADGRNSNDEKASVGLNSSPAQIVLATIIVLAIDNAIFALLPAVINITICLAVFERALALYSITIVVVTLFSLFFFRLVRNPFAFAPLMLVAFLAAEYTVTWYSAENTRYFFYNHLYIWNLINAGLTAPTMGDLDAPLVYELVFLTLAIVVVGLLLISVIYRKKLTSSSGKQERS